MVFAVRKTLPQTPFALSTGPVPPPAPVLKVVTRGKTQFALSTVDPRIVALDLKRAAKGVSHQELCAAAPLHPSNWYFLRAGMATPRASTLKLLAAALDATVGVARRRPPNLIAGFVVMAARLIAREAEAVPGMIARLTVVRARAAAPSAIAAGRLKALAIYLTAVELMVENAELGRALGCSRQNVHKERRMVEDLREDAAVDAFLERCRALLTGGGAP